MSTRRLKASHPDYERINMLTQMLAYAKNPALFFSPRMEGGEPLPLDLGEPELAAIITEVEENLEKELDGGVFADFINGLMPDV